MSKANIKAGLCTGVTFALVVAIVGIISPQGGEEATPVVTDKATIGVSQGVVFAAGEPTTSGIENVYIVDNSHAAGYTVNFSGNENVLDTIQSDTDTASIDYDTPFVIVVAVKGHEDNMANVQRENMKVELASSDLGISAENKTGDTDLHIFDGSEGSTYVRVNAVWDNSDTGYSLGPGDSASLTAIKLWTWS